MIPLSTEFNNPWFLTFVWAIFYSKFSDWRLSVLFMLVGPHLSVEYWWFCVFLMIGFSFFDFSRLGDKDED